jgi:hypothetical protein
VAFTVPIRCYFWDESQLSSVVLQSLVSKF